MSRLRIKTSAPKAVGIIKALRNGISTRKPTVKAESSTRVHDMVTSELLEGFFETLGKVEDIFKNA